MVFGLKVKKYWKKLKTRFYFTKVCTCSPVHHCVSELIIHSVVTWLLPCGVSTRWPLLECTHHYRFQRNVLIWSSCLNFQTLYARLRFNNHCKRGWRFRFLLPRVFASCVSVDLLVAGHHHYCCRSSRRGHKGCLGRRLKKIHLTDRRRIVPPSRSSSPASVGVSISVYLEMSMPSLCRLWILSVRQIC